MKFSFSDLLPTSFEVTVIPLVLAYVFVGLTHSWGLFPALIAPMVYLAITFLSIAADATDTPLYLTVGKCIFTSILVTPMYIILVV